MRNFLDKAEKAGINFFAYRYPGEQPVYGCSSCIYSTPGKGFVVAPFLMDYFIRIPDNEKEREAVNRGEYTGIKGIKGMAPMSHTSTTKGEYMDGAAKILRQLKSNSIGKVVYSRVIVKERGFSLSKRFAELCDRYPTAFVFCYYTEPTGCWIGCTPELLLESDGKELHTMALAGTRTNGSTGEWDAKNMEEQQIVTDYIVATMKANGITPHTLPRRTKKAGPVEHLCTPITANITAETNNMTTAESNDSDRTPFDLLQLLRALSPTPALAGYPKEDAIKLIRTTEKHSRGCYGGFIGPMTDDKRFSLFVNLRSMMVDAKNAALFVGGGYTHLSDPESEWIETENKAATLA